jgi:deoxyribose-phosphate aldolase
VSQSLDSDTYLAVPALIDHTALKPEVSEADIRQLCSEAISWQFASVCVNPYWVAFCAAALRESGVRVCTVVGFPLGANTTGTKRAEAEEALRAGAQELDVVQNIGALRSGRLNVLQEEVSILASLAHEQGSIVKVILETALLSDSEKKTSARLAADAGADFVKTSTGFSIGGATAADVALLRSAVGPIVGVKASGGVRTLAALQEMVQAGATRIGTSSGVQIMLAAQKAQGGTSLTEADRSGSLY